MSPPQQLARLLAFDVGCGSEARHHTEFVHKISSARLPLKMRLCLPKIIQLFWVRAMAWPRPHTARLPGSKVFRGF